MEHQAINPTHQEATKLRLVWRDFALSNPEIATDAWRNVDAPESCDEEEYLQALISEGKRLLEEDGFANYLVNTLLKKEA